MTVQRLAVLELDQHGVALRGCEEAEGELEEETSASGRGYWGCFRRHRVAWGMVVSGRTILERGWS